MAAAGEQPGGDGRLRARVRAAGRAWAAGAAAQHCAALTPASRRLGFPASWGFHDVYGFEPDLLGMARALMR